MTLLEGVATTKVINVFSSAVATAVFLWRGVVDGKLGHRLGLAMFFGALLCGHMCVRPSANPIFQWERCRMPL